MTDITRAEFANTSELRKAYAELTELWLEKSVDDPERRGVLIETGWDVVAFRLSADVPHGTVEEVRE